MALVCRDHPPADPPVRLTSRNRYYDQENTGAVKSRLPGATAGHRPHRKINPSRTPQASTAQARKIEARVGETANTVNSSGCQVQLHRGQPLCHISKLIRG
jgi:hypothetical protein